MKQISIDSFQSFISEVDIDVILDYRVMLYRGQHLREPLLPSIARTKVPRNTTEIERTVLSNLIRRFSLLIEKAFSNEWEWLIYAQHFGLKTRLLDWTSNPLIALWFACTNEFFKEMNSYVCILCTDDEDVIDFTADKPFERSTTKILWPTLNNHRIIAQAGWFTAHGYSVGENRFIPLEEDNSFADKITEIEVPSTIKQDLLMSLSKMGVNSKSVFPDVTGLCQHLNWKYKI